MTSKVIGYWVATALTAALVLLSAFMDLTRAPPVMDGMVHLGFPPYLPTLLGVWKVLAVLAIVVPGLPRLKEWAYAGLLFDLSGAAVAHVMSSDAAKMVMFPIGVIVIAGASWWLRSEERKLVAGGMQVRVATVGR